MQITSPRRHRTTKQATPPSPLQIQRRRLIKSLVLNIGFLVSLSISAGMGAQLVHNAIERDREQTELLEQILWAVEAQNPDFEPTDFIQN
jgi:hypothetical protein